MLDIHDLHVAIDGNEILKGVTLSIGSNEIHALMGPNGHGKSTLLAAIMGHPNFEVTQGSITLNGEDVLEMEVHQRSKAGLFLAMQYPQSVPGVTNSDFLKAAINAHRDTPIPLFDFIRELEKNLEALDMKPDLAHRFLNEGFSGGEKKRNEILQMRLLKPKLAMLDEIDSGLDIDALRFVADAIKETKAEGDLGLLIISHYGRFYDLVNPTHVHVLVDGKILESGDKSLADKIDSEGYEWLAEKYGVIVKDESKVGNHPVSIGTCAYKGRAQNLND